MLRNLRLGLLCGEVLDRPKSCGITGLPSLAVKRYPLVLGAMASKRLLWFV